MDARIEKFSIVPNTCHVVHGDDSVAVANTDFEQVLENSMEIKRVGGIGPGRSSTNNVLKLFVNFSTWKEKGALTPDGMDIGTCDCDVDCGLECPDAKLLQAAETLSHALAKCLCVSLTGGCV